MEQDNTPCSTRKRGRPVGSKNQCSKPKAIRGIKARRIESPTSLMEEQPRHTPTANSNHDNGYTNYHSHYQQNRLNNTYNNSINDNIPNNSSTINNQSNISQHRLHHDREATAQSDRLDTQHPHGTPDITTV